MVDTDGALAALGRALRTSDHLPMIHAVFERPIDQEGVDAYSEFPLIDMEVITKTHPSGTPSFVEYVYDDNNNEIGEIYERVTNMRVQINVWTISGTEYDAVSLSDSLDTALSRYDEDGYNQLLTDETGEGISSLTLNVEEGSQGSRQTPGGSAMAYLWQQDVFMTFTTRLNTMDEFGPLPYVVDVNTPRDGDFHGTDVDGEVEAIGPYDDLATALAEAADD